MSKMKILLVDDEPDFLKIMEARIKEWGHDLITVSRGTDAILAATRENPDVIILDYIMPDMDGVTVLEEIRKTGNNAPVIMLTAYPNKRSIKGTQGLGIAAFIPKLSTNTDVHLSVREVLKIIEAKKG